MDQESETVGLRLQHMHIHVLVSHALDVIRLMNPLPRIHSLAHTH